MKQLGWLLKRVLIAAVFFTLLAFALNNLHDGSVNFFFGTSWRAPQVLIVLASFALGLLGGALAMVPRWWRQRRAAQGQRMAPANPAPSPTPSAASSGDTVHGV